MSQQQHTQEPVVRHECPGCGHEYTYPVSQCDCLHEPVEFKRIEYFTLPPDAAARIAELEAENERDHAAFHRLADRFSNRLAELEKQRDTLLAALEQLVIVTTHLKPCPGTLNLAKKVITNIKEQA